MGRQPCRYVEGGRCPSTIASALLQQQGNIHLCTGQSHPEVALLPQDSLVELPQPFAGLAVPTAHKAACAWQFVIRVIQHCFTAYDAREWQDGDMLWTCDFLTDKHVLFCFLIAYLIGFRVIHTIRPPNGDEAFPLDRAL